MREDLVLGPLGSFLQCSRNGGLLQISHFRNTPSTKEATDFVNRSLKLNTLCVNLLRHNERRIAPNFPVA